MPVFNKFNLITSFLALLLFSKSCNFRIAILSAGVQGDTLGGNIKRIGEPLPNPSFFISENLLLIPFEYETSIFFVFLLKELKLF